MILVEHRLVPEAVVDMQGAHAVRTGDPHGHVQQAGGVATPGEEHEHRPARGEQAIPADLLDQVTQSAPRWTAMKISVVSVNPFSLTSAIRSNSRCVPARSTTGRVTRTSPPAERAPTREAMFTARP